MVLGRAGVEMAMFGIELKAAVPHVTVNVHVLKPVLK